MRPFTRTLTPELTNEELAALLGIIRKRRCQGKHLEIGTAAGGTLCSMMKVFEDHERPPFVVVDPMTYFQNQLNTVKKNLQDNGVSAEEVDFRIMKSDLAFMEADQKRESFDFIFIDGAHKIHYVTDDLRWTRLLNDGGIVCLHDYTSVRGVTLAVDRFLRKNPHYVRVECVNTLLILRKTKEGLKPEISFIDRVWASFFAPLLRLEVFTKKVLKRKIQ
ncbi:MAG: class I SAM-dependent methyltransferase [Nitrospirae bacterium]|nr:class I SAM-dependent methyltransferase [Nitrospirota bacterium]